MEIDMKFPCFLALIFKVSFVTFDDMHFTFIDAPSNLWMENPFIQKMDFRSKR